MVLRKRRHGQDKHEWVERGETYQVMEQITGLRASLYAFPNEMLATIEEGVQRGDEGWEAPNVGP